MDAPLHRCFAAKIPRGVRGVVGSGRWRGSAFLQGSQDRDPQYVEYLTGEKELYDLLSDPYETESLHESVGSLLVQELKAKLNTPQRLHRRRVPGGRRLSVATRRRKRRNAILRVEALGPPPFGCATLRALDQRFGVGEMLLRLGIAMLLFAVALATVVAVVVNLSGPTEPVAPEQARSEETTAAPARGEREVQELPVVSDDWPRPSREEIDATRMPATMRRNRTRP
jgi:hypothetical protein